MAYRLLTSLIGADAKFVLVIALGAYTLSVAAGQDKPIEAWWLRATFAATDLSYDSMPVASVDPKWVRMSALSYSRLPSEAKEDLTWMRRDGYIFRADNQFRRKGAIDRVICGVYEDRDGRRGRFLLVLERFNDGAWKVAYLHQEAGEAGFSTIVRRSSGLYWGTCLLCDEFSQLRLRRGSFVLDQVP